MPNKSLQFPFPEFFKDLVFDVQYIYIYNDDTTNIIHNNYKMINNNNNDNNINERKNYIKSNKLFFRVVF